MKKLTFFIIAIFINSFLFSQLVKDPAAYVHQAINATETQNDEKSAWIGGGYDSFYSGARVGDHFFIAGSEFSEIEAGNQITKVRFYHHLGTVQFTGGASATFTNTSYTVKIFENPTLGGDYAQYGYYDINIGTPVFEQTVVLGEAESGSNYELTLTTPYTVNSNDFWVAISFNNGIGALKLGQTANPAYEGLYYMYYTIEEETFILNNDFGNQANPRFVPFGISLFVDDGGAFEENVDLAAYFLDDEGYTINGVTIFNDESLTLIPATKNWGNDPTSQSVNLTITSGTVELLNITVLEEPLAAEAWAVFFSDDETEEPYTFTAQQLDDWGLTGTFDITLSLPYTDDADPTDNTKTFTVNRVTDNSSCDLATSFVDRPEAATRVPITEITILEAETLVIYPLLTNNGPDATNNNIEISITSGEVTFASGTINATGQGAIAAEGSTLITGSSSYLYYTPAFLDQNNLTGTFTITFTATYGGEDSDATNNTATLVVNRTADNSVCDIAASFVNNNTDMNAITETSIADNANLVLYPTVTNNGPDATNNFIKVSIKSGETVITQETNLTFFGEDYLLASGSSEIIEGSNGYLTLTAAQMNTLGLTGTFTLTFAAVYQGTDNTEANNTATLTVTRTTTPVAQISATTWNAGDVTIDQTKESSNFTLKNNGTGTLTVSNITSLAAPWTSTFGDPASINLAAGASHTFKFSFVPTEEGDKTQDFVITTNGGTVTVALSGKGVVAAQDPVAEVSVTSWDAGDVSVNATKDSEEITLTNTGEGTLTVSDITELAAPWTSTFGEIGDISLAAGASHTFKFTFAPTEEGDKAQDFVITTNGGAKTIQLKGKGTKIGVPSVNANEIKIYPNPSNGLVNVTVTENSVVKVFDITGKVISTQNVNANGTITFTQSAGMYFVQVESNGKVNTKKLIIE